MCAWFDDLAHTSPLGTVGDDGLDVPDLGLAGVIAPGNKNTAP
jgi:hypothetical protein